MAFSRRRFSRRRPAFRRRSGRRPARRSFHRRRTTTRRRPMTYRRVVNAAARKRLDTMTSWSDVVDSVSTDTFSNTGATIIGGTTSTTVFGFMPTARGAQDPTGVVWAPLTTGRQRTSCYIRGAKENVSVETNSSASWRWRRVVFECIGNPLLEGNSPLLGEYYRQTPLEGYKRLVNNAPDSANAVYNLLFRGENQDDWVDPQIAALDRKRVKVHFDRKMTINAGSAGGMSKSYKFWHGVNKTLNYDDRENAMSKDTSVFASETPNNCGDFYIFDFITPGFGATATDTLSFTPNCTFYWHEK